MLHARVLDGIIWPASIAPYRVVILPIGPPSSPNHAHATALYDALTSSASPASLRTDILLDDRAVSPGVKMKTVDLMGIPTIIVIGRGMEKEGTIEIQARHDKKTKHNCKYEQAAEYIRNLYPDT